MVPSRGLEVPEKINAEVELLIGQHVPEVLEPSEIRTRRGSGPYLTNKVVGVLLRFR